MKQKTIINITIKIMVVLWIVVVLTLIDIVRERVLETFNFNLLIWIQLIAYTLIGVIIAISNLELTDKDKLGYNHNIVNLVFAGLLFVISVSMALPIDFIYRVLFSLGIIGTTGLHIFQILFGYSLMQLFIKK